MVNTTETWNNDLSNESEERELTDHDFEREEDQDEEEREPLWRSDEDYGKER